MTWYAAFQCLNCEHSWREPAPADAWEMVRKVAAPASCPLCGARMDEGQVELLSHQETKIAVSQCRVVFHTFTKR
ncbi:MAG: hypothetical protein M0P73_05525 [Syntrophobacterales bacterium]|nr:hypothetical protein [Syntrophobacterales bacterium]